MVIAIPNPSPSMIMCVHACMLGTPLSPRHAILIGPNGATLGPGPFFSLSHVGPIPTIVSCLIRPISFFFSLVFLSLVPDGSDYGAVS